MEDLNNVRKDYTTGELSERDLPDNPMQLLEIWLAAAKQSDATDYNAMQISSIDSAGFPNVRVVLLRALENDGFLFYTNYESDKAQELEAAGKIGGNFFWKELERQFRFAGSVARVSSATSDAYFASRPRASQIGAWVSAQSKPIDSREVLEERVEFYTQKFEGQEVPRPENWGGYKITPHRVEFWQGRASRLHDRISFTKETEGWTKIRLQP